MAGWAGLVAAVGGLFVWGMYLNQPAVKAEPLAQTKPAPVKRNAAATGANPGLKASSENRPANQPVSIPNATGIIQPGENVKPLEIQATPMSNSESMAMPDKPMMPEPMKPEAMKPEAMTPETPKPDAPKPDAPETPKPDTPKPDAPKPDAPKPDAPKPDSEPAMAEKGEPAAEVKLTGKEQRAWQEVMKATRAGLSKLDPVGSEKQIAELTPLAKTPQQKAQLATLEQAVALIRKAREGIVAGIKGMEGGETFMVGNSTELAFVEGDETHIVVHNKAKRQDFKLDAMPAGMGMALMKLKPNVIDANYSAAMGAYAMVHPKNNLVAAEGKKLLEEAASAGAISKEVSQFYADDYKLR